MHPRALALALGISLSAGCVESVTLGNECASVGLCPDTSGGGAPAAPPPAPPHGNLDASVGSLDASSDAGAALDASDAWDAADASVEVDGGEPPQFPALSNGSFEITRGEPGALALEPFDPLPIGMNLAEPWAACRLGLSVLESGDSARNSGARDVLPREGRGFVQAEQGFSGFSPIAQKLPTPMKAGERYGFRIDVRAAVGSNVSLELWGAFVDCLGGTKLADVGVVSESWSSPCVTFSPLVDISQILLQPVVRGASSGTPRLFFDNLRPDPTCR